MKYLTFTLTVSTLLFRLCFALPPHTLWTRTYGGGSSDVGYSVQETYDKGFIISGVTLSYGAGHTDLWLIRTDSLGDTVWTRVYGGRGYEYGRSVRETHDNGFIIAGYTTSYGQGAHDVWLVRTDSLGHALWMRTFGYHRHDRGYSVQETKDNGFIITGYSMKDALPDYDVWLICTDSIGTALWTKRFGGIEEDIGYSIQQTWDSGYVVVGNTHSFGSGDGDVWLLKIKSDVGIEENEIVRNDGKGIGTTIISGPLLLPKDKECRVYDITGRTVAPDKMTPGIYIIEIDGKITEKVVKVR